MGSFNENIVKMNGELGTASKEMTIGRYWLILKKDPSLDIFFVFSLAVYLHIADTPYMTRRSSDYRKRRNGWFLIQDQSIALRFYRT